MKKFLFLLFILVGINVQIMFADVPQEMTYQVMVLNPKTGAIQANKDVSIKLEIRQGSQDGTAVFSHDYDVHTDNTGCALLALQIPTSIDWSSANYYFVTILKD